MIFIYITDFFQTATIFCLIIYCIRNSKRMRAEVNARLKFVNMIREAGGRPPREDGWIHPFCSGCGHPFHERPMCPPEKAKSGLCPHCRDEWKQS